MASPITEAAVVKKDGRELVVRSQLPEDRRGALAAPVMTSLQKVVTLGDLVGFQFGVTLYPLHQYEISTGRKNTGRRDDEGKEIWEDSKAVAPNGSGYDHLNRVAGVQFVMPRTVADQTGKQFVNPIHRRDYLYLSLIGVYRNDVGQLTSYREDIEVDFQRLYEESRMNATWTDPSTWTNKETGEISLFKREGKDWKYKKGDKHRAADEIVFLRDEQTGKPLQNEDGMPIYRLNLPEEIEARCTQRLYDLRKFGLRYAYTVAKNRIMASATGIKKLPLDHVGECVVSVVSWRDLLNPEQRAKDAQAVARGVWGAAIGEDVDGLTEDEMAELGDDVIAGEYADVTNLEADVEPPQESGPLPEEQEEIRAREAAEAQA